MNLRLTPATLIAKALATFTDTAIFFLSCFTHTQPYLARRNKTMTSIKKRTAVDWDTVKTLYPFSNSLQLTKEQRVSLASMTGHQMSAMHFHSKAMENARNLLRKMAKNNHYDKSAAKTAASTIANSHASLSMLQVEREYQLHLLLNDSQARQYKEMKSKGQLTID